MTSGNGIGFIHVGIILILIPVLRGEGRTHVNGFELVLFWPGL